MDSSLVPPPSQNPRDITDIAVVLLGRSEPDLNPICASLVKRLSGRDTSILLVRAFIQLREMLSEHTELKRRLQDIEIRLAKGFAAHEEELQELRFLIAQLEQPPEVKKSRIGF